MSKMENEQFYNNKSSRSGCTTKWQYLEIDIQIILAVLVSQGDVSTISCPVYLPTTTAT